MRLFVALDIEEGIRKQIGSFMQQVRALAPDVRWVPPESLHVTLKFIGERPDAEVKRIEEALGLICHPGFQVCFRGCGFFPTPRAARVFWIGIEAEAALASLAGGIESALGKLGIPEDKRAFSPHLTLARVGSGAPARQHGDGPNRRFFGLQQHLAQSPPPDFGTMTAREFFLYRSQLSSQGARYTRIARFRLDTSDR